MAKQKIFFSYARADGSAFALRLAVDLKEKGFDVWMDQEDIRAGSDWDTEIEKALDTCDCLLFIETEKSVISNNVLDEVYYVLEQHKKVIPVIAVDSKTPFRLKRLQHIDFTKDYNSGLSLLVNELRVISPMVTYLAEPTTPEVLLANPANSKKTALQFFVGSLVILIAAVVFFLITKNNSNPAGPTQQANVFIDSSSNKVLSPGGETGTSILNLTIAEHSEAGSIATGKKQQVFTGRANKAKQKIQRPTTVNPKNNNGVLSAPGTKNLSEMYEGDWRLVEVEPKAQSYRGYLKIETLDAGKVNIKSYMQFYYPENKAPSYLTVFNAFANCTACVLKSDLKLVPEDVAIGSRTIKTLKEDQPGGGKAGDVILDANSNKSIRTSVALHFIDANKAVIKVQQPVTIALAHELMLEPFVYTFRFKKND